MSSEQELKPIGKKYVGALQEIRRTLAKDEQTKKELEGYIQELYDGKKSIGDPEENIKKKIVNLLNAKIDNPTLSNFLNGLKHIYVMRTIIETQKIMARTDNALHLLQYPFEPINDTDKQSKVRAALYNALAEHDNMKAPSEELQQLTEESVESLNITKLVQVNNQKSTSLHVEITDAPQSEELSRSVPSYSPPLPPSSSNFKSTPPTERQASTTNEHTQIPLSDDEVQKSSFLLFKDLENKRREASKGLILTSKTKAVVADPQRLIMILINNFKHIKEDNPVDEKDKKDDLVFYEKQNLEHLKNIHANWSLNQDDKEKNKISFVHDGVVSIDLEIDQDKKEISISTSFKKQANTEETENAIMMLLEKQREIAARTGIKTVTFAIVPQNPYMALQIFLQAKRFGLEPKFDEDTLNSMIDDKTCGPLYEQLKDASGDKLHKYLFWASLAKADQNTQEGAQPNFKGVENQEKLVALYRRGMEEAHNTLEQSQAETADTDDGIRASGRLLKHKKQQID